MSAAPASLRLPFSVSLTLALSSPPCPLFRLSFYLNLSGRSGRNCLLSSSVLSDYNGSPNTRFSQETTRLMSWSEGERYSCPLQSFVVSLLFSRIGSVLSYLNSSTHRGSIDFHLETCAPSSRSALSRFRCNGHSLLLSSYLSKIGSIENSCCRVCGHLSSHSALSSNGIDVPLALWRHSVSLRPLVQALGSCPASGAPWSSAMLPSLGRGRIATTTALYRCTQFNITRLHKIQR